MSARLSLDQFWRTAPSGEGTFQVDRLRGLPDAVQRYLQHAFRPGSRLPAAVRLRMHGEIKLQRWLPLSAEQVIRRDRGMIWQAKTRVWGLPVRGSDRLVDGEGSMRWKMLGLIPVMTAAGPDVTRATVGRLEAESIWLPSVFHGDDVSWRVAEPNRLLASLPMQGETDEVELTVNDAGRLDSVKLQRWGNPEGGEFRYADFGARVEEEGTFEGLTVPTRLRVGWHFGTERFESHGEFFRVTIDDATYK